jgi:Rad3-related DNA helicase
VVEQQHQRRFSPRKNRWKEIAEFDRRVRDLRERQTTLNDEIGALEERHRESERADQEALATWAAEGKGKRPDPTAPAIRERIEQLVENREALSLAVTRVLKEKGEFVEKH